MDCLLTVVAEIHNRGKVDILHNLPSVEELRAVRQKKLLLTEGVAAFNEKPKKGIKYLQEHGILGAGASQFTEMAAFLRSEPRLDKRQIGEYISCRGGQDILSAFIKSFDLSARPLDAALRSFLTTFRLPGESRLIERIFEEFALHWFTTYTGDKVPKDTDCTFVLCYAVIQLNVDQHNKQVKNPMTIAQFRNNQRKLNGGDDFPPKYLEEIYDNIKESEIVLPAEQKGAIGEDFKWQAMLGQAQNPKTRTLPYHRTGGSNVYDHEVFGQMWGPTVTSLCCVLDKADDHTLEARVLTHLRVCAGIASAHHLCDVFDSLIVGMCKRIVVADDADDGGSDSSPVDDDFVSRLGRTPKVQTTLKLLFELIAEHGNLLRHGWQDILDLMAQLFVWRLLPVEMTTAFNFVSGGISLNPALVEQEAQETSFFGQLLGLGGSPVAASKARSRRYVVTRTISLLAPLLSSLTP
jgi:brefeldin A-resistance guanine nucleotide exchange factor 1